MRRKVLTIVGAAALIWGVLAIALDSASLRLLGGSGSAHGASPRCLPTTPELTAALPGTGVDVSPAPGSQVANPATQISFLGAPAAQIRGISAVGSDSGRHAGRLRAYSQGDGASFLPAEPFAPGERVDVRAIVGAGARAHPAAFHFRVDSPYPTAKVGEFPNPPAAPADYQSFHTVPGVQPPVMTVTVADRDPAAGDILTTNGPGPGQYGPLIYTPQGRLVWFQRLAGGLAAENLSEQSYAGSRVLTWWKGRVLSLGFGQGEDLVMDSRYRTLARVTGGNGLKADLHEFQLAANERAYITAYNLIRCDLSSVKGAADGAIADNAVQEIDMRTGLVRWEWHSLDHVGASESEVEVPSNREPWDYFHVNAIDQAPDGNLLITARSTWAAYLLQAGTGKVLWRLGGNRTSFKMGRGTRMAWQHDGRVLPDGEISFFDDGSNPPIHHQSRGLRIALDLRARTARLSGLYIHHEPPLLAASQGNMQTLPGQNSLVGYGAVPQITEYSQAGEVLFDAHQPFDMAFYRAFRFPWRGRPSTPPAVVANLNTTGEATIVFASWNGASDVASWRVLAGQRPASLKARAEFAAAAFESSITLAQKYAYVAVQALDSGGHVLGFSPTVRVASFAASLPQGGGSR